MMNVFFPSRKNQQYILYILTDGQRRLVILFRHGAGLTGPGTFVLLRQVSDPQVIGSRDVNDVWL